MHTNIGQFSIYGSMNKIEWVDIKENWFESRW